MPPCDTAAAFLLQVPHNPTLALPLTTMPAAHSKPQETADSAKRAREFWDRLALPSDAPSKRRNAGSAPAPPATPATPQQPTKNEQPPPPAAAPHPFGSAFDEGDYDSSTEHDDDDDDDAAAPEQPVPSKNALRVRTARRGFKQKWLKEYSWLECSPH